MDYTTIEDVLTYSTSEVTPSDTEQQTLQAIVTSMSRSLDTYCNMAFGQATYIAETLRAVIDRDGVLTCYPAVPTIASFSAASWRVATTRQWTSLDTSLLDVEETIFGCVVRVLDRDFTAQRSQRVQVQLSYVGGWAYEEIPADFSWNVRRLCWWAYQKRAAPIEKQADPATGQVYIPSSWPKDVRDAFSSYIRQVPM